MSTTCDEILSWMLETWMKNHSVNNNTSNTVNSLPEKKTLLQGTTNNVGLTFSVVDNKPWITTIDSEQDIWNW